MTKRYRALTRLSYARALVDLVDLARVNTGELFSFGPLQLSALEQQGLTVSGADLSQVSQVLDGIYGLVEVPA